MWIEELSWEEKHFRIAIHVTNIHWAAAIH